VTISPRPRTACLVPRVRPQWTAPRKPPRAPPHGRTPHETPTLPLIAVIAVLSACDGTVTVVDEYRLSGTVRLLGLERDAVGMRTGEVNVDNVTGVRTTLTRDGEEIRTATTKDGTFRVRRARRRSVHGGCRRCCRNALERDERPARPRLRAGRAHRRRGLGRSLGVPDPFSSAATAAHYFVPVPRHVRLIVQDPAGTVVRTVVDAHSGRGEATVATSVRRGELRAQAIRGDAAG